MYLQNPVDRRLFNGGAFCATVLPGIRVGICWVGSPPDSSGVYLA